MESPEQTFSYKQEMWRHLADYKLSALGVKKNGIWRKNHREYAHILPSVVQRLNILEPYRDEFGKAKPDESHITKFETIYSPALNGKFASGFFTCDVFLNHYQLMRNVWNLGVGTGDTLVCVVPKANSCLAKEIEFLKNCLSEP